MNKFKNAAIEILKEFKVPMHYKVITKRAIEKGILISDGKTPDASMNAQLITEVNALGESATFIKTASATFALNPNRPPEEKSILSNNNKSDEENKVGGGYIGKAGEHFVTCELLLRGFNASIMSVDVGMDIIATNNNKLFSLQVKTSSLHANDTYIFDMRKVALERDYAGNVFYVFVMIHDEINKSALVLPAYKVDELIHSNAIKDIKTHEKFRVTLKIRKDEIFIGTLDNPIDYYWNNWDVIK
jgi:hypothetical protein